MGKVEPKVILIGYTKSLLSDNPESLVAVAGKLCYSKVGITEIAEKMDEREIKKYINILTFMGHLSTIEHVNFTFAVEGISRTCSHQIVRHRISSYSQQSQRYVDLQNTFQYIIPEAIYNNENAKKLYIESMDNDFDNYKKITESLYNQYISEGMSNNDAGKKAIEDARFVLPNACETKMIITMNARSLLHFLEMRMCNRAQWEIRIVAEKMLDLVLDICPNIFMNAGAPCTFGKCHEGKMSCGHPVKPNDKQKKLMLVKNYE